MSDSSRTLSTFAKSARWLTPGELGVLGWLFLLSIGQLGFFAYPTWTSRAVLVAAVVPIGLVRLAAMVRARELAAALLAALVAVMLVAALAADESRKALVGAGPTGQSVVFILSMGAVWALGRTASRRTRDLAAPVVVASLGLHLVVAALQLILSIDSGPFAIASGRPTGLATNPVYFGALMVVGVVYAARRVFADRPASWLVALAIFSCAVTLSGSRIALFAAVVTMALNAPSGSWGGRIRVVLGVVAGTIIAVVIGGFTSASTAVERGVSGDSGGRLDVWRYGWSAFLERPILGWGPGNFRVAIEGRLSDAFVTTFDVAGRQAWTDPHNIVVSTAVGSGLTAAALLVVFVWAAARSADPMLLSGAGAVALTWLFQPMFIVTAPIAFFLLGCAAGAPGLVDRGSARRLFDRSAIVLGVAVALVFATLDLRVATANSLTEESRAWETYRPDPVAADALAERFMRASITGHPEVRDDALRWAQRAVDYEPDRATWWARLSYRQLLLGDEAAAAASSDRAIELQPNEPQAWLVKRTLTEPGSPQSELANERVCTLVPDQC